MTLLYAFEAMKRKSNGGLDSTESCPVSQHAMSMGGSTTVF